MFGAGADRRRSASSRRSGTRREDEPRQGRRPLSVDVEPAPRARLPAAASSTTHFQLPDDDGRLRPRRAALRRRRQVPPHDSGGDDVPELHGDPRGEALDARPRPAAVRDAARRADRRRLAQRRGRGRARPLPRLQGLQRRLPGQRRHGDATRPSSSRTTTPGGCGPRHAYAMGLDLLGRREAGAHAAARQPAHAGAGPAQRRQGAGRHRAQRRMPPFAHEPFTAGSAAARPPRTGGPRVLLWPDTFNNYFRPRRPSRRRGARGRRASRSPSRRARSAAAGRSTTGAGSAWPSGSGGRP